MQQISLRTCAPRTSSAARALQMLRMRMCMQVRMGTQTRMSI